MKRSYQLTGILMLLIFILAACGKATPTQAPTPTPTPTMLPEPTAEMTEEPIIVEIIGPAESISLTRSELQELPVSEGYAGIKSSTGKITPPRVFSGVALSDLVELVGGIDESIGFNVVAEDGYSITFSYNQIVNGQFIAYDPATGEELKNPVTLTPILAYDIDGEPLNVNEDGNVRLAIISDTLNQVTDGHWAVKWVNKLEAKQLGAEWILSAHGAIDREIDRASIESCGSAQCHGASWTDNKAQVWGGVPLWLLVGTVDDEIPHEGPAFNDELAAGNYSISVIAADGYTVTFDAARIARNNNIIVAYKVNENPLTDKYFPLRLVGSELEKSEMVGSISELTVDLEAIPTPEAGAGSDTAE